MEMDFFDEDYYDGKPQSGSETEIEETPEIGQLEDNVGRLRFRADLNLPEKYRGERISLSEYKKSLEKESASAPNSDLDFEVDPGAGGFEPRIQLSDSISAKVAEYKQLETEFSILDNNRLKERMTREKEKGESVKIQRKIWSDLLAIRIFAQNVVKLCNQLPPTGVIPYLDEEIKKDLDQVRGEILSLFSMSYEMQLLLNGHKKILTTRISAGDNSNGIFSGLQTKSNGKRIRPESEFWDKYYPVLDNTLEWCIDVCDEWKKNTQIEIYCPFEPTWLRCLGKTNPPVEFPTGNPRFSWISQVEVQRKFRVLDQSLRIQLEQTLINKDHALKKSYPNPNSMNFVGIQALKNHLDPAVIPEFAKEIYDDSDHFISLLKEIIASRSVNDQGLNSVSSSLLTKGKKTDNGVDRRASKGRKIRYVPIPKLENFMASSVSQGSNSHLPGADNEEFVDCIMSSLLLA
ncbi:apoptosis-antagonizing transcription factor [Cryptosporidium felis]|nr:apoptosis-antagonizing transcription factor [Cryptosporidium felis]